MSRIIFYCLAIALVSLLGGWFPLAQRISHVKLQVYLSLSAGAMLGAAFFHMMPESAHLCEEQFGLWMAVGVLGLYVIERFLSPHSHETVEELGRELDSHRHSHQGGHSPAHAHTHAPSPAHSHEPTHSHEHPHSHEHVRAEPCPKVSKGIDAPATERASTEGAAGLASDGAGSQAAAPRVAGWSAVIGLFLHTLMGGAALGSAVLGHDAAPQLGFAVFVATVLHKPADSFTISTLLTKSGYSRGTAFIAQIAFAGMIPLGVVLFGLGESALAERVLQSELTGGMLAFSAGTFVCIALSDLLPEVQFHSHDRMKLFMAVILGAAVMYVTALFEPAHAVGHAH
ncbi:MAG: ZIP family metal transporter [Phycisphaerales bacterium]|nr:ZIP family metal transporter [Phycisphaerales bacterium]